MEYNVNNDIKKILNDRIEGYPMELDRDAVGLWQIIGDYEKFNLSDKEFKEHLNSVCL